MGRPSDGDWIEVPIGPPQTEPYPWTKCEISVVTAHSPDTLLAGPAMFGAIKALANLPPNTDRRKVKRLLRKAMRQADRSL